MLRAVRRGLVPAGLTLCLMASPGATTAFELFGSPYDPDQIPVPVSANPLMAPECPTDFEPYIRAGSTWNKVSCSSFRFKKRGLKTRDAFRCDGFDHIAFAPLDEGVLAVTSINCFGGQRETGIFFNDRVNWSCGGSFTPPGKVDLETVALHEFGHMLGLGHTDQLDSVMFPTYQGQRRFLGPDDRDGVCFLYPKESLVAGNPGDRDRPGAVEAGSDHGEAIDPAAEVAPETGLR